MLVITLIFAPFLYFLGVVLIICGIIGYLMSRAKLFLVNTWLQRPLDVMSGSDAALLFISTPFFTKLESVAAINAVLVIRGRPELTKFQQHFLERVINVMNPDTGLRLNSRWRQRPVRRFGYFVWEEDDRFDVKTHIRESGERYTDDASLVKLVEKISHASLPEERVPWEVILISKMAAPGTDDECAVLLRVHHALADGVNLLAVLDGLVDKPSCDGKDQVKMGNIDPSVLLVKNHPLLRHLANSNQKWSIRAAKDVLINMITIGLSLPWVLIQEMQRKRDRNSLHGPALCGRRLMGLSGDVRLHVLKDIAKTLNCSISDIFIFCLTGAIQRCNEAATKLTSVTFDDFATLLMPMHFFQARTGWTQNGFAITVSRYPLLGLSPQLRLLAIAAITRATRTSAEPLLNFGMVQGLTNHLPLALIKKSLLTPMTEFTAMATNLVGPTSNIAVLGFPVDKMFFFPIVHSAKGGVAFSLMSYNGSVHIGVTVDRVVSSDDFAAQRLADDCVKELHILQKIIKNEQFIKN